MTMTCERLGTSHTGGQCATRCELCRRVAAALATTTAPGLAEHSEQRARAALFSSIHSDCTQMESLSSMPYIHDGEERTGRSRNEIQTFCLSGSPQAVHLVRVLGLDRTTLYFEFLVLYHLLNKASFPWLDVTDRTANADAIPQHVLEISFLQRHTTIESTFVK